MSQVYGVYLNSRITVRPGLLGFNDDPAAKAFMGYLIRSLVGRIYEWSGRDIPVHWAYIAAVKGLGSSVLYGGLVFRNCYHAPRCSGTRATSGMAKISRAAAAT